MSPYDNDRDVVPVAAVFGANASGKSNLLDRLRLSGPGHHVELRPRCGGEIVRRLRPRSQPSQGDAQSRFGWSRGVLAAGVQAEDGQEQWWVVFDLPDGGGDPGMASLANQADHQVTEGGHDPGAGAGLDLGRVLTERDITQWILFSMDQCPRT